MYIVGAMKSWRLVRITYLIDYFGASEVVDGYALDWPTVRLCFRHTEYGWRCDHYDSGLCAGDYHPTLRIAIIASTKLFEQNIQNGKYARVIRRMNSKQREEKK